MKPVILNLCVSFHITSHLVYYLHLSCMASTTIFGAILNNVSCGSYSIQTLY